MPVEKRRSWDPFGSISEMEDSLRAISAPHALIVVDGAGHELKRGRFDLDRLINALWMFK